MKYFRYCISILCFVSLTLSSFTNFGAETDEQKSEEVKQGKRYFLGLLPSNTDQKACSSCHYFREVDSLQWGPSAFELQKSAQTLSLEDFSSKYLNPMGKRSTEAHKDYKYDAEEKEFIYTYIKQIQKTPKKLSINQLLLFLILGVFITWAILELLFFRKIKYTFIPGIILLACLAYQFRIVHVEAMRIGRSEGYAPDQPIRFSHEIHAGQNEMDCKYCHNFAVDDKSSGIPSTSTCMNCHILVREGTHSGKYEIAKVVSSFDQKLPVTWTRIHNLPDHVYYNHAQHVNVAQIECETCHGEVAEMKLMKQNSDLSMGWCVNCHRETEIHQFKSSEYYKSLLELQVDYSEKGKLPVADDIGANDCMRCHY